MSPLFKFDSIKNIVFNIVVLYMLFYTCGYLLCYFMMYEWDFTWKGLVIRSILYKVFENFYKDELKEK